MHTNVRQLTFASLKLTWSHLNEAAVSGGKNAEKEHVNGYPPVILGFSLFCLVHASLRNRLCLTLLPPEQTLTQDSIRVLYFLVPCRCDEEVELQGHAGNARRVPVTPPWRCHWWAHGPWESVERQEDARQYGQ